jgi:hypothetical protein
MSSFFEVFTTSARDFSPLVFGRERRPNHYEKFSLFFSDFHKLSMLSRLQALNIAARNAEKAPKIAAYGNEFFNVLRKTLKESKFEKEEKLSPAAVEEYYRIRFGIVSVACLYSSCSGAITFDNFVAAFKALDTVESSEGRRVPFFDEEASGRPTPPKATNRERTWISEFLESVVEESFRIKPFTEDLQVLEPSFTNACLNV